MTSPALKLNPDNQAQSLVEIDDDDDEEGIGDGIGDEDDDAGLDDEDGDEREPSNDATGSPSTGTPRRIPRPLPRWLQKAFETVVEDCDQRDSNGPLLVYARDRTFWFRCPSTYFLLQKPDISP